jgi:transcriptional regulator with XRE-family HTH domain
VYRKALSGCQGIPDVANQKHFCTNEEDILNEIKSISGKCIEGRRRMERITQAQLAAEAGIGVRWLREIESGSPKPSIEDHLRCAGRLGLPAGYFFLPMMFLQNRRSFPADLLHGDMNRLQEHCIEFIIEDYYLGAVIRKGRRAGVPVDDASLRGSE